jgi:predicted transcriptional regulator
MANQIFQGKDEIFSDISENRGDIYNYILLNPGTYLRKIFKDVGLAMRDTQYHLSVLEKKDMLNRGSLVSTDTTIQCQ